MTLGRAIGRAVRYARGDHAAFVSMIAERPFDDTPTLVYADYLDESGDPGAARLLRDHIARRQKARTKRGWPMESVSYTMPQIPFNVGLDHHGPFVHWSPAWDLNADPARIHVSLFHRQTAPTGLDMGQHERDSTTHMEHWAGYSPAEAHAILGQMPNVLNAAEERARLESLYPHLRGAGP